jgi:poly(ribitol-phosphate) beta-N-acetylglucosaminyltransferase
MLQHWYRGKILKRLSGRHLLRYKEPYRNELLDVVRPLTAKRFPTDVDPFLSFPMRVRSALLRANRVEEMLALARMETGLKASAFVTSIGWEDSGRLRLEVEAKVFFEDESLLQFEKVGSEAPDAAPRWTWRPPDPLTPEAFAPDVITADVLDATPDLLESRIEVFVRARHDGADYVQPVEGEVPEGAPGMLRTTVTIDPRSARSGRSVTKFSDLVAQVSYAGWNFGTALRIEPSVLAAAKLQDRTVGKRVFTVGTRGSNRLFIRAEPVPSFPKGAGSGSTTPPVRTRAVRKARRIAGRIRRRLLKVIR